MDMMKLSTDAVWVQMQTVHDGRLTGRHSLWMLISHFWTWAETQD